MYEQTRQGNGVMDQGASGDNFFYGNNSNSAGRDNTSAGNGNTPAGSDNTSAGSDNQKANLIVNYLPQKMTDNQLLEMFSELGTVKQHKIVRDKNSGYSFGFGFVEYETHQSALSAIENLNGVKLQNKTLKVAFARPAGEDTKGTNLYLQNVPKSMSKEEVEGIFSGYGKIIQCKILVDQSSGSSKGVGFVLFENKAQAQTAMDEMNGKVLMGGSEPLIIKYAAENAKKVRPPAGMGGMGGFAPPRPPPMRGFYGGPGGPGGPMRNQPSRYPNRFNPMSGGPSGGNFGNNDNFGGGGGGNFGGGYQSRRPGPDTSENGGFTLYVNNLGQYIEDGTVWSLFSNYGPVLKVDIMRDATKDNTCKNFGFVTMANYDDAANAIVSLNGIYQLTNKPLLVSFKTNKRT